MYSKLLLKAPNDRRYLLSRLRFRTAFVRIVPRHTGLHVCSLVADQAAMAAMAATASTFALAMAPAVQAAQEVAMVAEVR